MTRDELHRLVDSLPEAALEPAGQALQHFLIWPQQPFLQIERMRQKHRTSESIADAGKYSISGGGQVPSGRFYINHWEQDSAVVETHIFHDGHEIVVTERVRMADGRKSLEYEHEIAGPKGKTYSQKLSFKVD